MSAIEIPSTEIKRVNSERDRDSDSEGDRNPPVGWRKPRPQPSFELIATVMKQAGNHKALIRSRRESKICHVAVGGRAAKVVVGSVERHSVTLKESGVSKVYRLKW